MTHTCDLLPQGILSVEQAQTHILGNVAALQASEPVSLWQAQGRILAETVCAPLDVPPHRNSAMDGYAINHADLLDAKPLRVGAIICGSPVWGSATRRMRAYYDRRSRPRRYR